MFPEGAAQQKHGWELTRLVPRAPEKHKLKWVFKPPSVRSSQRVSRDVDHSHVSVFIMNWSSSWSSLLMNPEVYLTHLHSKGDPEGFLGL